MASLWAARVGGARLLVEIGFLPRCWAVGPVVWLRRGAAAFEASLWGDFERPRLLGTRRDVARARRRLPCLQRKRRDGRRADRLGRRRFHHGWHRGAVRVHLLDGVELDVQWPEPCFDLTRAEQPVRTSPHAPTPREPGRKQAQVQVRTCAIAAARSGARASAAASTVTTKAVAMAEGSASSHSVPQTTAGTCSRRNWELAAN